MVRTLKNKSKFLNELKDKIAPSNVVQATHLGHRNKLTPYLIITKDNQLDITINTIKDYILSNGFSECPSLYADYSCERVYSNDVLEITLIWNVKKKSLFIEVDDAYE